MSKREILGQEYLYSSPWLKIREDRFLHNGSERVYDVVERSHSVVIIPITESNRTILIKHYRYPTQKYSLELPMGGINDSETKEQAARRELFEEVKISVKNLEHIGEFHPVPGLTNQEVDVYIAKVKDGDLDEAKFEFDEEDIEGLSFTSIDGLFKQVSAGEITDGFTLSSLFLLRLYLEKADA
jgi:ADP-ribose pyrophosphatase